MLRKSPEQLPLSPGATPLREACLAEPGIDVVPAEMLTPDVMAFFIGSDERRAALQELWHDLSAKGVMVIIASNGYAAEIRTFLSVAGWNGHFHHVWGGAADAPESVVHPPVDGVAPGLSKTMFVTNLLATGTVGRVLYVDDNPEPMPYGVDVLPLESEGSGLQRSHVAQIRAWLAALPPRC